MKLTVFIYFLFLGGVILNVYEFKKKAHLYIPLDRTQRT